MHLPRRDRAIDAVLCAAIAAYSLPPTLDGSVNNPQATLAGALLLPVLLVPIPLRRLFPLGAAFALAAGCVISGIPTFAQFRLVAAVPVAVIVLFPLASRATRARALGGLAAVAAGLVFVGATESVVHGVRGAAAMAAFALPFCLVIFGAGLIVASRERVARELSERSVELRRQREATAALAVEIDHESLAADLDRALRSRLEEMIAAASPGDHDAATGRARFARIELLGRDALDRMRTLLGLLRTVDRGTRAPRPTLEQLDALLAEARAGGRVVDLEIDGNQRPLAAGIELTAYRTLQHALLAVAGTQDRPATVCLRYFPDRLELEVDGAPLGNGGAAAALMAARERVLALGGSFSADSPTPERRVLRALLPATPVHA
jgi:glucose-6-phosphate-specific signal transduction histidine kinase